MLTSAYNSSTLTAHNLITVIDGHYYSLGSDFIKLKIKMRSVSLQVLLTYTSPMSSSLGVFGSDTIVETKFEINIIEGVLQVELKKLTWTPTVKYNGQDLYIIGLPKGSVEIKLVTNNSTLFWSYFQSNYQIPGSSTETNSLELSQSLYQALASKDYSIQVSCVTAITNIIIANDNLPAIISRVPNSSLQNTQDLKTFTTSISSNLVCAIYLLCLLQQWADQPHAQYFNPGVEQQLLNSIKVLASTAVEALDLRTGLVFAQTNNKVYSNPSSIATICANILWHELVFSYNCPEYSLPLLYTWSNSDERIYNSNLEPELEFNFSQKFLKYYSSADLEEYEIPSSNTLFDCSNLSQIYQPLVAFLPDSIIIPLSNLPKIISLPRSARTRIDTYSLQNKAAVAYFLATQLKMMPYGYMWPTAESLNEPSSVWRALFQVTSSALAFSLILQLQAVDTDPWLKILMPAKLNTSVEYWQEFTNNYYSAPKFGYDFISATSYASGLTPISTTLLDYLYLQLPPTLVSINYPELTTLDALDSKTYQAGVSPDLFANSPVAISSLQTSIDLKEAVYLESNFNFSTPDRPIDSELRPLNLSNYTNWVALYGEGKPKPVVDFLISKVPVYTTCYVYFHTTSATPIRSGNLKFVSQDTLSTDLPVVSIEPTPPLVEIELSPSLLELRIQRLDSFGFASVYSLISTRTVNLSLALEAAVEISVINLDGNGSEIGSVFLNTALISFTPNSLAGSVVSLNPYLDFAGGQFTKITIRLLPSLNVKAASNTPVSEIRTLQMIRIANTTPAILTDPISGSYFTEPLVSVLTNPISTLQLSTYSLRQPNSALYLIE
jgi:hypothetical protein